MGQRFEFGFFDCLICEQAGILPYEMHTDVNAIIKAADAIVPLAGRLGVPPPPPHLYQMAYCHVSTLGCQVVNGPELKEPSAKPCLKSPADIDNLREPDDYLACGVVPQRLEVVRRLKARRPDASAHIGHDLEGPVTTAGLMLGGETFFMLPYDDPGRAHRLLDFCLRSILNYTRTLRRHQGRAFGGQTEMVPDDFGGMFPPPLFGQFVSPYWDKLYCGAGATRRILHSELLREGHLPLLAQIKIDEFDPSVDQFLPAEVVARACPVPYCLRIWPSRVRRQTADELVAFYRHLAGFKPTYIMFHLEHLADLPKIEALLKVARELEK
jgi:hypothetical protein